MASSKESRKRGMPDAVTDTALRGFLGYHLRLASRAVLGDLARALQPFGLRMVTFTALRLIAGNPGMRQSQLARALSVERSNLVQIVDELERQGLIRREQMPSDRRSYSLRATPEGERLNGAALRAVEAHEARIFGAVPDEDRKRFAEILALVRRRADEGKDADGGSSG
ncbi:MarR family transcriptional regulator [Ostreiculturibacter nitratireducens]|uniref:MarR family winged helix-turn-helix transcriptional regulator n=1 Tax=Ostreiculturibacter nitratireducens TaxID=3075226 RepID=UPI0031B635DE